MMPAAFIASSPADSRLLDRVRRRSWAWLAALRRQLEIEVQLLDESTTPLLEGERSSPLTQLFESEPAQLRELVATARERGPQQRTIGSWVLACVPLPTAQQGDGTLLVAKRVVDPGTQERMLGRVKALGNALVQAVHGHLSTDNPGESNALERVTSLTRILADVAVSGSDRQIVERFAEVMSVWHDVDVTAYVVDLHGDYVRAVTLPGVDLARSPAMLTGDSLPAELASRRTARADSIRLGFVLDDGGTLLLALSSGVASGWLFALTGPLHEDGAERAVAFVEVLDAWLGHAAVAASGRFSPVAAARLQSDGAAATVARNLLEVLSDVLHGAAVSLAVTGDAGLPLLHADAGRDREGARVHAHTIERIVDAESGVSLAITLEDAVPVTPQTQRVLRDSADMLQPWVRRIAPALRESIAEHVVSRSADAIIDRPAREAVERGIPVSVLVIRSTPADISDRMTRAWLDRIKPTLRSRDVAEVLAPGELGIFLPDTPSVRAEAIGDRLRALLAAGVPKGHRIHGGVAGATGRLAGSLTQLARAEAISRAAT